jgi:hypothetical protein
VPITYRIDSAAGVVHVTFSGRVTVEEFRSQRAALSQDPMFRPEMHRISDARDMTELPSLDELRSFAGVMSAVRLQENAQGRSAVIVGSPGAYGAGRQYQTLLWLAGMSVDILTSDEEASAWLAALPAQTREQGEH